jgi:dienelactone hydrolase
MKRFVGALVAVATAFGVWHGKGLVIAFGTVPAVPLRAGTVDQLVVSVGVQATSPAEPYVRTDLRMFVDADWRRRPRDAKFPVVLYLPGWGGKATDSDVLLNRLGGAGYMVFAIDDVAFDPLNSAESEAGRTARTSLIDLSSPDGISSFVQKSDLKSDLAVEKLSAVLDGILARRSNDFPDLLARVDPARIAVVGFSFGGAVATEALKRDSRIVAAINLDGWIYGRMAAYQVDKPYLMLGSTNSTPPLPLGVIRRNVFAMNDLHLDRIRRQLELPDSRFAEISGTLHGDFSDGLHGAGRWTLWRPWHPPLADPTLVRATIDSNVLGFLAK